MKPVSYTHLDVYKRQAEKFIKKMKELGLRTETGLAITGTKAYLNEEKKDKMCIRDRVSKKLNKLNALIDKYYLYEDEIDTDKLAEGIYSGYTSALGDKYTVYYDEDETKALMESTSGTFSGDVYKRQPVVGSVNTGI